MAQANLKAVISAEDRASGVIGGVGSSFGKLTAAFAAGQLAANAFSSAVSRVTDVVKDSVGASFNQVRSVENATIALRAYEKSGDKVNTVLKDLIAYARSDTGVLFQREDLFEAAQTLKLYGQETDTLVDKVKILSKGVSLGKTSFQELSSIVGRAAAKGRLDAVDFDMLIERGIGLDKSMRGAAISGDELFQALDDALPDELIEGRAKTIDGAFTKLESGLRDFGSAILGVDKETTTFIEGGLGDRFIKAIRKLTDFLSSPEFVNTVKATIDKLFEFGKKAKEVAEDVAEYLLPKFKSLGETIRDDIIPILEDLWHNVLEPIMPVLGGALVVAIGLAVDALKIILETVGWVYRAMEDGNPIILGLVGLFGTLAAVMAFNSVFNALTVGFNTLRLITIPNVMASITTMQALISSPLVMGAIAISAALAAAKAVYDAWSDAQGQITKTNDAIDALKKNTEKNVKDIQKSIDEGKISAEDGKRAIDALTDSAYEAQEQTSALSQFLDNWKPDKSKFNFSNPFGFASGGFTGRGNANEIAGVVHRGEYVLPKTAVDQTSGMPKITTEAHGGQSAPINITVQAGAYMGNRQDARKYAQMIFENLKDVAQSNGMTVSQMIGS